MANNNKDQLILFNQPIEVLVEVACTVERAAELVKRSKGCLYRQLNQNKRYLRDVTTGKWIVYPTGKKDSSILVNVAFEFAPTDNFWRLAELT